MCRGGDDANGIAEREATAEPRTVQLVADADIEGRRCELESQIARSVAGGDGPYSVAQDVHWHGMGGVGDQKHFARRRRGFPDLTEQARSVDHGLPDHDAITRSLVQNPLLP